VTSIILTFKCTFQYFLRVPSPSLPPTNFSSFLSIYISCCHASLRPSNRQALNIYSPPFGPLPAFPFVVVQVPVHSPLLDRVLRPAYLPCHLLPFSFEKKDVRSRVAIFRERDIRVRNPIIRLLRHALECNLGARPLALCFVFR